MNILLFAAWFADSFIVYSILRRFDERSTAKLADRVDLQKHEVNPTITWLARRIGLKRAFLITWIVIGTGVGLTDAVLNLRFSYEIPVFAFVIGFAHIFAAANNTHVAYVVDKIGVQEFELEYDRRMKELAAVTWKKRINLIFKGNPSAFLVSILSIPLISLLIYALVATELFTVVVLPYKFLIIFLNIGFTFLISMILIQSAFVLGPLILARRYSQKHTISTSKSRDVLPGAVNIELPVSVVTEALDDARSQGSNTVRIAVLVPTERV